MALSIQKQYTAYIIKRLPWMPRKLVLPLSSLIVIVPAVTALAFSYGPMVTVQPESGSLSGGATAVVDASASGGQSLRFSSGASMPDLSNTGPRYSLERTLTPDQALTELRQTGYLSRVLIDGTFRLANSDGVNWVIEDSVIRVSSSTYGLQTYNSIGAFTGTQAQRAIFRYVEIRGRAAQGTGRCSSAFYGSNVVIEHADMYGCDDIAKVSNNVSILNSWLHDNDHPAGAHCDSIQIVSGTNILIRGTRLDAYVGYSSDGSTALNGQPCSGALQTGSETGNISATWENNWFAGGGYTIRGASDATYAVDYIFHNNRFLRFGTSVALNRTDLVPHTFGPVYGNTSTYQDWVNNVWDDTEEPVN